MRTLWLLPLLPWIASAQSPPASLAGVVLERDAAGSSGQFLVRAADAQVFRFQFDAQTRVEREQQTSEIARLRPGEKVEVVSEPVAGSVMNRAKLVKVIVPLPPAPMIRTTRLPAVADRLFSPGNLTFSGVVSKFTPQRLVLHTREGDRTILIRQDTRYVADGGTVEAAALQPNMRVFVQAGKDIYERVEAYRIIWGRIFDPGK